MRSLKYVFLIALGIVLYSLINDYINKRDEESELKSAFRNNLKECVYFPFDKLNQPYFTGSSGYLIPNNQDNNKDFDLPWKIRTYSQTGPEIYTGLKTKLLERTRVKVINEHIIRHSSFSTYLTIQCLDTLQDKTFIVRGDSFSEIQYWNCPLQQAIQQAPVLARLNSGAELPTSGGQWVSLSDKSVIICTGLTGFHKGLVIGYAFDPLTKKVYYDELTFKIESLHKMEY